MASREPSILPSSPGDTVEDHPDDSHIVQTEIDDTISEVVPRTGTPSSARGTKRPRSGAKKPRPKKGVHVWVSEAGQDGTEDEATPVKVKKSGSAEPDIKTTGTAVGTRRQANGTVGSVYSGSKIRHIKKPDGIPLWRKEIQYAFLHEVVHDETKCFTRIGGTSPDASFADIYTESMARSSKTSKVLKDRLHVDQPAARNMAMICLLVNVGRMNTTLNFFPEMRAQLRTYHPIPALQAYPTQKDYKSLQDAPRLKSILKGASEDTEEPRNLAQLRAATVPRTNPVNVIFVLSQAANEISQSHFLDKIDFFDLAIRPTITSHSRARAFLWLMWWYLESDFSKEAALNNPFGPGEYKEDQDPEDPETIPLLVPELVHISEEQGDAENVDPEEEIQFGEKMTKERERLNQEFALEEAAMAEGGGTGKGIEHKGVKRLKRSARETGDDVDSSDVDSVRASPGASARSPAPTDSATHPQISGMQADSLEDDWEPMDNHPGRGRYKRVRGKNTPSRSKMRNSEMGLTGSVRGGGRSRLGLNSDRGTPDTGRGTPQPFPPGVNHPVLSQFPATSQHTSILGNAISGASTKSRARTGYQRELENHRQKRIDWLVNKKRRETIKVQREKREKIPSYSWILCAAQRISSLDDTYDSDEDDSGHVGLALLGYTNHGSGLGGVIPKAKRTDKILRKESSDSSTDDVKKEKEDVPSSVNNLVSEIEDGESDVGEEVEQWKRVLLRTQRRLHTWSGDKDYAALLAYKHDESQKQADLRNHAEDLDHVKSRPREHLGLDSIPPSSIANSTPRKPRRERRKSLDDEITQDLLAERSADEDDRDIDIEDDDGDITMESTHPLHGRGRSLSGGRRGIRIGGSDVEME